MIDKAGINKASINNISINKLGAGLILLFSGVSQHQISPENFDDAPYHH